MKKLVPALLMMATTAGVHAQTSKVSFSKNPEHRAKVIQQATKGANKPTSVYYRISATSMYIFNEDELALVLEDSGAYKYSNARGSSVDFDELTLNDYGLDGTVNYDTAIKYSAPNSPSNRYTATFNTSDKRTAFTMANYTGGQNFTNNSEEKAVLNANGDITTRTYSTWNGSQNKWEPTLVTEHTYNTQKMVVTDSTYNVSSSKPQSLTYYTYDGNGNLAEQLSLRWNGSAWDSSYRTTNTYYANNKVKTILEEGYDSNIGGWEYSYLDSMGYTAGGELDYRMYREWNTDSADWMNTELETRAYSGGQATTLTVSTWDEATGAWNPMMEANAFYTTHGNISKVIVYPFMGGVKLPITAMVQNLYYEEYYNVNVKDAPKADKITVYPNPATTTVNIVLGNMQQAQVQLLNMNGQVVRSVNAANQQQVQLNTSGLAAGNYLLNITSANGAPARQTITIQ